MAFGKGQTWPKKECEKTGGRTSTKQYQAQHKGCCPSPSKGAAEYMFHHKVKKILYLQDLAKELSRELNIM